MKLSYLFGLFIITALITPIKAPLPALLLPLAAMFGAGTLFGPKLFGRQSQVVQVPSSSYGAYSSFGGMGGGMSGMGGGMGSMGGLGGGRFGEPFVMPAPGGGDFMSGNSGGGFGGGRFDQFGRRKRRSLRFLKPVV